MNNELPIDPETIDRTRHCPRQFRCLSCDTLPRCSVIRCINERVHFVDCDETLFCPYKLSWGEGHICTCPVRKELYSRYRV